MKKLIIPFFFILFLSSCAFFNQNLENSENNSGAIYSGNISENTSQAESENNLQTEYEIISEKSYFYTNPDDTEPRKAYVMKGDRIIANNEKSTENMIFATYTNSSGKITEGYLKKETIYQNKKNFENKEKQGEKNFFKNTPKCKNSYDFLEIPDGYGEPTGKIRLHFGWENADCQQQKKIEMIPEMFDSIEKFYKGKDASTINSNIGIDTGWGYNILDIINLSSKEISVNGEKILITATKIIEEEENGTKTSYDVSVNIADISFSIESSQDTIYQDLENISDNLQKYFSIEHLPYKKEDHIEKERVKKEREEKILNDKLNKIMAIKWTADMLAEARFGSEGQYIVLYTTEKNIEIRTGLSDDKGAIPLCNDGISKSDSECRIEKIQGGKIYWKSESWHTRNLHHAVENSSWTQYFITDIKAETTKLVKEESSSGCIYDDGRETNEYCE